MRKGARGGGEERGRGERKEEKEGSKVAKGNGKLTHLVIGTRCCIYRWKCDFDGC